MKTKLLRKLNAKIKKHLTGDGGDFVFTPHTYDPVKAEFVANDSRLIYVNAAKPIAPVVWKELDLRSAYFMKYWKSSRFKDLIKVRIDLGEKLKDVLIEIVKSNFHA